MLNIIHHIPILTTVIAVIFTIILYNHWRKKPSALYLAWWTIGVLAYGIGTFTESMTTIFGWQEWVFRSWYISGALLGGAPLAQGTVYLLLSNRTGHILTAVLLSVVALASVFVILSPLNYTVVESGRLSGEVFEWQWVRAFSPFINTYAFVFLVGGAVWSAWKYFKRDDKLTFRAQGNIFIAIGALLPGIGGSFTRVGYVEVLYVTELIGLIFIWIGYHIITGDSNKTIHKKQVVEASVS